MDEPLTTPVPFKMVAAVIEPPNCVELPAIVIASCANLAIGISSLSTTKFEKSK